jgi:multicomponent Na+:H+ antiporter subunit B
MIQESKDVIVKTMARLLAPFIMIYALYVIMHGHHSPGGGFQGGVILAASFILLVVAYGIDKIRNLFPETIANILSSVGVFIYGGIGLLCLLLGGKFLDYGKLTKILSVVPARARNLGILGVEIGVALAVMSVMCIIVFTIFSSEDIPEDKGEVPNE